MTLARCKSTVLSLKHRFARFCLQSTQNSSSTMFYCQRVIRSVGIYILTLPEACAATAGQRCCRGCGGGGRCRNRAGGGCGGRCPVDVRTIGPWRIAWIELFSHAAPQLNLVKIASLLSKGVDPNPNYRWLPKHEEAQLAAGVAVDSPAYQALEKTAEPGCRYTWL